MSVWNLTDSPPCCSQVATVRHLLLVPPFTSHSRRGSTTGPLALPSRYHTLPPPNMSLRSPPSLQKALSQSECRTARQTRVCERQQPPQCFCRRGWHSTLALQESQSWAGEAAGRQCRRTRAAPAAVLPAPSPCLGAEGSYGSTPFPLTAGETTGPQVLTQPGRPRFPQVGKREHAGIFLFAFETQMPAIRVFLCVSDGKCAPALGALWLGLVAFVSLVCQQQVILVRFPSKQQTDT